MKHNAQLLTELTKAKAQWTQASKELIDAK
jgi:hypothetical protein